jgi:hypothetical protein
MFAAQADRHRLGGERLDQEEGIGDPRSPNACQRWPEGFWLVNEGTGEACIGCCRATNLCECARRRYLRETVRMLVLDASEVPPTIFCVLTAREFLRKDESMRDTFRQLLKAIRRRWPDCEWFARWEEQARGALHVNLLVKGVPAAEFLAFQDVLVPRWCARVDAEPAGQYVEPIIDEAAVTVYVANKIQHAGKSNQEPSFRNKHRTSQTRGYLVRSAAVMREEARRSLAADALEWSGMARELVDLELEDRDSQTWRLVRLTPGRRARPRAHERESIGASRAVPGSPALAGNGGGP